MHWRTATVLQELRRWDGVFEYSVLMNPGPTDGDEPRPVTALAYADTVGACAVGDVVMLNASALLSGLGTGGFALIVSREGTPPRDPQPSDGHIIKARYTPLQQMVLGVDEQDSPHHDLLAGADSLDGVPVVVADLHSALPAIVAGWRERHPGSRVAYVMTDGAALPAKFSRTLDALRDTGWIAATITAGQAYGGEHDAVSVHSALLAARLVVGADAIVVSQGPGNVGTGTRWGFSGLDTAEALHAAHVLGGTGIASLRVSGSDARQRHRGISHHSTTAYGRALLAPATLVIPDFGGEFGELIADQARELVSSATAELSPVTVPLAGLEAALAQSPTPLSSMGRSVKDDPTPFLAAAAAGRHAASLVG